MGGLYTIEQAETESQAYRIDLSYPSGEYLLIENRQPEGLDGAMPQGGLAIYHIDEAASYTTEGYPGQAGWPENGNHYRIALLQADGLYQLERGLNRGNAGDVYHAGGVSDLGPDTVPDTHAYQGGAVYATDNRIFDVSAAGAAMTFRFEVTSNLPPVAVPAANPESGETPLEVAFDGSGSFDPDGTLIAYAWDFGDGNSGSGVPAAYTYEEPGNYTASSP
jgi:hypothetical protein